jgi:hypothetical protein
MSEHTILDPHGTRYENQDPAQLDEIPTNHTGGRA